MRFKINVKDGEVAQWVENSDEIVIVYYPKEGKSVAFRSTWDLVHKKLRQASMMAVCAPYFNTLVKRLEDLEAVVRGERPEGRPLSMERDVARRLISSGLGYNSTLYLLKSVLLNPAARQFSPTYDFSRDKRSQLRSAEAKRIRNAVDREWRLQKSEIPPRPQRMWWKDKSWIPGPETE
ncbi:MAG: hypothetical protein ACE5JL_12675, partial [Dehalococcoidia bacterium]